MIDNRRKREIGLSFVRSIFGRLLYRIITVEMFLRVENTPVLNGILHICVIYLLITWMTFATMSMLISS